MFSGGKRPNDAVPTSSMADIAFLLLIFFLVTTVFPKDAGLALTLPKEEAEVSARNLLLLEVGQDGEVRVRSGESPRTETVSAEGLARLWRREVRANPSLIAAIRVDPNAAYGRMIAVLDQLHLAGAQRVSLQAAHR